MKNRSEIIQSWINARKERNEITRCVFYITVPKDEDFERNGTIEKVKVMLERNLVTCKHVDTVDGAWDLNRDWIESGEMDCIVEYCGVYPVDWDIEDVVEFERMETNGEIVVLVDWVVNDQYVPNH